MNSLLRFIISHNDDTATVMASIFSVTILSLFLVFFFVTLLHCYAQFLTRGGRRPTPVLGVPPVVTGAHRLLILRHLLNMDSAHEMMTSDQSPAAKGLDPRVLSSIPVFAFDEGRGECGLECVICLSLFGIGEMGRRLALCGHAFHVGCIDMWLHSHTTCPVCRAPAVCFSCSGNDVVLDSVSEDHRGTDVGGGNVANSDERRMSSESFSGLEIVVEVSSSQGRPDGTRKVLSSNRVE